MSDLASRLRALPGFPEQLPDLDVDALPADPDVVVRAWLEDAIASGARQPHALTLLTRGEDGAPDGRTLILKDIDQRGYHVATSRTSAKGRQLATDPRAAMVLFWRESGRQVRLRGTVTALDAETSRRDWFSRPSATGAVDPDWQVYALLPDRVELMQAREDRRHTRVLFTRLEGTWERRLL